MGEGKEQGRKGGGERMYKKHRGVGGTECRRERERGEGEVKDRGREHEEEEEAEEERREEEGGRDQQRMPDGFQQNKCVFT